MANRLELYKPYLYVEIDNIDVSAYITPYLTSFHVTDNDGLKKSESDDVQIEVEDSEHFFRDNPPARGSSLKVIFGYEEIVKQGQFFIDSYSYHYSRSGATFNIKALAKDVKAAFRTLKTTGFENMTLKSIAQEIANRNHYQLFFDGDDIHFQRVDQYKQRDLEFLQKLCKLYGYICKIADKKIIIREIHKTLTDAKVFTITPDITTDFEIDVSSLYDAEVSIQYLAPSKKAVIGDKKKTEVKASGDTQEIRTRIETKHQADKVAQAQKTLNDMDQAKGRITTIGLPQVYASCQIELKGFGANFDGLYYCSSITHEIRRSGYTTEIEFTKNPKAQGGKKKK